MVAIVILLSGFVGLASAAAAWYLEGGFIAIVLTYAVAGNLTFAVFSSLVGPRKYTEDSPDFTAEIEADLKALLEERIDNEIREASQRRAPRQALLRRPLNPMTVHPRQRGLFRPR